VLALRAARFLPPPYSVLGLRPARGMEGGRRSASAQCATVLATRFLVLPAKSGTISKRLAVLEMEVVLGDGGKVTNEPCVADALAHFARYCADA
jgi:hypothetical protein